MPTEMVSLSTQEPSTRYYSNMLVVRPIHRPQGTATWAPLQVGTAQSSSDRDRFLHRHSASPMSLTGCLFVKSSDNPLVIMPYGTHRCQSCSVKYVRFGGSPRPSYIRTVSVRRRWLVRSSMEVALDVVAPLSQFVKMSLLLLVWAELLRIYP
jgi:hypothetical protein